MDLQSDSALRSRHDPQARRIRSAGAHDGAALVRSATDDMAGIIRDVPVSMRTNDMGGSVGCTFPRGRRQNLLTCTLNRCEQEI
jgi:hypothetical protein